MPPMRPAGAVPGTATWAAAQMRLPWGYDGLEIVDVGFTPAIGGNQVIVFDPRNVVVVDG